jgi:hypothetical protein
VQILPIKIWMFILGILLVILGSTLFRLLWHKKTDLQFKSGFFYVVKKYKKIMAKPLFIIALYGTLYFIWS